MSKYYGTHWVQLQLSISSEPVIPKFKIITCSLTRTGVICGDNGTKKIASHSSLKPASQTEYKGKPPN